MTQTIWSSGAKTVAVRTDSTSGTTRAYITVNMPSSATWSFSPFAGGVVASCTAGGKTYTETWYE